MKIAVFTKNRTNPAYDGARLAADRIGAQHGASIRHYVPDIPDDPQQQSALIDQALLWRPDAVLIAPVHPIEVGPAVARVVEAGIPIFGLINPLPGVDYVTYVGSNDTSLAKALARHLFARMNGHGTVVMIEGPSHSVTNNDRVEAFLDEASQFPGIRIAARIPGDYQRASARDAFAAFLAGSAGPEAVLSANDVMALGALDALDARARTSATAPNPLPLIAGINAIPEAIDAIAQGRMLATADFNPMQMAALCAECAIAHHRGEAVPRLIDLPVRVVDRQVCSGWTSAWEGRPLMTLKDFVDE